MKKERILLYRDNDALRYAKEDNKEIFKVMESLLTLFDAYIKVGAIDDYVRFFDNPLNFMILKYREVWNGNLLLDSKLRADEVKSLKERFDKLYDALDEWKSAPVITRNTMVSNVKPKNFDLYCRKDKEQEYLVLINFIEAVRMYEDAFKTQSRKQISRFTDSLLDKNLLPRYELFAQFISK